MPIKTLQHRCQYCVKVWLGIHF